MGHHACGKVGRNLRPQARSANQLGAGRITESLESGGRRLFDGRSELLGQHCRGSRSGLSRGLLSRIKVVAGGDFADLRVFRNQRNGWRDTPRPSRAAR